MLGERTTEGLEVRLRPRGIGRFVTAAFLSVWLCGWTAGEGFALYILYGMGRAFVTGDPSAIRGMPASVVAAAAVGGFLLLWVSLWTLGGIMAFRELLRSLWAEDRIVIRPDGLAIARRLGPFLKRYEIPRDRIRRAFLKPKTFALAIETDAGTLEASNLGDRGEREETLQTLRRELAIAEHSNTETDASTGGPPTGWEEVVTPEGEPVLVQNIRTRRTQARVTSGLAMLAMIAAASLVMNTVHNLALIPGAIVVSAIAAALTWGASWLWRGRMEWRIGSGRITLRRRLGGSLRDVFEARSLQLNTHSDSDGDQWFALEARSADAPPADASPVASIPALYCRALSDRKARRRLAQAMNDPSIPRQLGKWLSRRADMPFEDLATDERRTIELAQLRAQLETLLPRMGPFGNVVRGLIDRAEARRVR
jgi:hypothetical protein